MNHPTDKTFHAHCHRLAVQFEPNVQPGANYDVAVEHDNQLWISGQVPRVQGAIAVTGVLGDTVDLAEGRRAAAICVLRALAIAQQRLGSLARVAKVLRMTVYVHSAAGFTQQSEVADAASEILYAVFAPNGAHTRTSVGVAQLPKNAAVEIDLVLALARGTVPA
jgi:enamine deaminase RidA (YjgF/YER057c/UK114 family)